MLTKRNPILVVNAFIRKGDKFLSVRRKSKFFGGMFTLPGGKVEDGENSRDALRREVWEETGHRIELLYPKPVVVGTISVFGRNAIIELHRAKIVGGEQKRQKSEIQEIKWINAEDFLENLRKHHYPEDQINIISEFLVDEKLLSK